MAETELTFEKAADYLQVEFKIRQTRRPAYSLRAFARDLQISPASLTQFLNDRQGMSFERLASVSKRLNWSDEKKNHVWDLIQSKYHRDLATRKGAALRAQSRSERIPTRVRVDSFKLISDWYHLALVELVRVYDGKIDERQMARQLNLEVSLVKNALARLQRLGYLTKEAGSWRNQTVVVHAGDEAASEAVRLFHSQVLDLAQKALQERNTSERDSLSIVYSVAQQQLPELRRELREAVLGVLAKHSSIGEATSVQALTLQLFPLAERESL